MPFDYNSKSNSCKIGDNVKLDGFIKGENNNIFIENPVHKCIIDLKINGNYNNIYISSPFAIKSLHVRIGNHIPAHQTSLTIAEGFSIESNGNFYLYNSGNKLSIGKNCMFSNTVTVRCGESPHLLFDNETGDYLDISKGVNIGNHVWVGERAYFTKNASISNECVVAACSIITKKFEDEHVVLAGNPAKIVRRNVQWIRNHSYLEPGSKFAHNYMLNKLKYEKNL